MLIEARTVEPESRVRSDVCIVGGGPAGIMLAQELSRTGLRVSVLESGGLEPEESTQDASKGTSVGYPYYPLEDVQVRALGGNTHVWSAGGPRSRPLDPVDLETRAEIPHSGWPFGWEELSPHYRRAYEIMRLRPTFDADTWARESSSPPFPTAGGSVYSTLFQFAPRDVFLEAAAAFRTSSLVDVYLHATVVDIAVDDSRREAVTHVVVASQPGRQFTVTAEVFVLASGGIGNARLLLASDRIRSAGLGNGHDLVGRFFQEHLGIRSGVLQPVDASLLDQVDFYRAHRSGVPGWMGMLGLTNDTVRRNGLLNSAFYVLPVRASVDSPPAHALVSVKRWLDFRPRPPHLAAYLATLVRDLPGTVRALRSRDSYSSTQTPEILQLKVMAEQAPNPASRVTLSTRRDEFGVPRARLDWRVSDLDLSSIRRSQDLLDEAVRAAGIGRVVGRLGDSAVPELLHGNEHQIGTTRMHRDPRYGVADADGRVHELTNLYVAGSSVFPSSGYANPTVTIVALAVRLAAHLKQRLIERRAASIG